MILTARHILGAPTCQRSSQQHRSTPTRTLFWLGPPVRVLEEATVKMAPRCQYLEKAAGMRRGAVGTRAAGRNTGRPIFTNISCRLSAGTGVRLVPGTIATTRPR